MLSKPKTKYIQTLGQKKFRLEEGLFIAEGPKLIKELLHSKDCIITEIYALPDWAEENKTSIVKINCTVITEAELEKISQLTTPNKVLALVKQFAYDKIPVANDTITLVLDSIQDPGNLGTIIRIADWFGIDQIICSPDTADVYNPKVVQSTMGSITRVKVYYTDLAQWLWQQEGVSIYAAALEGEEVSSVGKIREGIILIGNESKGISDELFKLADTKITIAGKGKAESLNAAVATGIILSHLL